MRYSFVFAAALVIFAAAPLPLRGEDAAPDDPRLLECRTKRGVVLLTPEPPHTPLLPKPFCADDLKRFDCQILSQIEYYMLYSYGECENNSDMFMQSYSRPACNQLKDKEIEAFNSKIYRAIPADDKRFFFTLRRTQYEKGCLPPNFAPSDY
jgi:hypothetical protein